MPRPRHVDEEVEERKVTLQIEAWIGSDGKVVTVNESAHLGTKDLILHYPETIPPTYECIGAYGRPESKIPVKFILNSLGTIGFTEKIGESSHKVTKDVKFNALAWLDEPEKVAALSDIETIELQNIGVVELNDKVIAAILTHKWSAIADAAMAIMQHASGSQEDFPKPIVTYEPDMVKIADHADDMKATLKVGEHTFAVGDKFWRFCSYGVCSGKERYAFTWMDVPVSYLNEPE